MFIRKVSRVVRSRGESSFRNSSIPLVCDKRRLLVLFISTLFHPYLYLPLYSYTTTSRIIIFRPKSILKNSTSIPPSPPLHPLSYYPCQVPRRYRHDRNVKVRKPYNQPLLYTEDDIEETFTKGSGRGGQSVSKTNNCVVLFHTPTGTMVRCHKTRSRDLNRQLARRELQLKLDTLVNGKDSIRARLYAKDKKRRQKARQKSQRKHGNSINGSSRSTLYEGMDKDKKTKIGSPTAAGKDNDRTYRRINYYRYLNERSFVFLSNRSNPKLAMSSSSVTIPPYPIQRLFGYRIMYTMYNLPLWKRLWLPACRIPIVSRY